MTNDKIKIFLVGMMGSGKSHWALKLSESTGIPHYDFDEIIQLKERKSIQQIFTEKGEEYFRTLENQALLNSSEYRNGVFATGGGMPCFNNNIQLMNTMGVTIWLDEPIDTLLERVMNQKSHRPAIQTLNDKNKREWFVDKLLERNKVYMLSKYHLSSNDITLENLLSILKKESCNNA